jgi:hypothetical protein
MTELSMIFIMLVALQVKHFVCDYPLQNAYMLQKSLPDNRYIAPLLYHSGVHALGMLTLCLVFSWSTWFVLLDFVSHFIIDRVKASPKLCGRWKSNQGAFWSALGLDQMTHHLIGILTLFLAVG